MESMFLQMSNAMMSAASGVARAPPCPHATPVMHATRPSRRPTASAGASAPFVLCGRDTRLRPRPIHIRHKMLILSLRSYGQLSQEPRSATQPVR